MKLELNTAPQLICTAQKMRRISLKNKTKFAVSCGFSHIYWRDPSWKKTSFFVQWVALFFNPLLSAVPFLYPLKRSENYTPQKAKMFQAALPPRNEETLIQLLQMFEHRIKTSLKWIEWKSNLKPWLGCFVYIFTSNKPNYDLPYCVTVHIKHITTNTSLKNINWLPAGKMLACTLSM